MIIPEMKNLPFSHTLIIFVSMLIMIMLPTISVTANKKVTSGSVLVAGGPNPTWSSPSGDFAFGFQQVPAGGYLLAVVFAKLPQRTIVWSANGDNIAKTGSTVRFSADGLVLSDPNKTHIWSANLSGPGLAYGAMLDNGNFLLARNDSKISWQSSDEPTDTLLPGQVLNQNGNLISRLSETNQAPGKFKFIMQTDGNLVLYPLNYPSANTGTAYWASNTFNDGGFRASFDPNGYVYVADKNGKILHYVFSKEISATQFHLRLTLDHDGVLRLYVHPKKTTGAWSVHGLVPSDICQVISGKVGDGVCGDNSVCTLRVDDRRGPTCKCPEGYSLLNPNDTTGGCERKYDLPRCGVGNYETRVELFEVDSTEWQDDLEHDSFEPVSEEWCSRRCLDDCYCDAAFFREGECRLKSLPLRHGRVDLGRGGKSFLKLLRAANKTNSN